MTFWGTRPHALALVELLLTGEVRRRRNQEDAWSTLLDLGWARRSRRSGVLEIDSVSREAVEATLSAAWPEWSDFAKRLGELDLPYTPKGLRELERHDRIEAASMLELPSRLNRRTAAAAVAEHSKAHLGPFEHVVLEDVDVTYDGLVRMRANRGLAVQRDGLVTAACGLTRLLGELVLSDRALRDGTQLAGNLPRAVLTIENLGAYLDSPTPEDVLVVHVPGWNTRTTKDLLEGIGDVPLVHFGDLDPNGIAIVSHLRRWRPDVRWFVPDFWEEYSDEKGLTRQWPVIEWPPDTPPWVRDLSQRHMWLEQEAIVMDERFLWALEENLK